MSQLIEQDDEIDLGELFAAIWYNWWVVGLAAVLSVFLSGYYAFVVAVPEYEASSRFELLDSNSGGPNFGDAAGLAALAGINIPGSGSEADAIQDRVLSRPFIESIYEEAGFATDVVFNGSLGEPGLIAKAIELVRGPSEEKEFDRDDYIVMAISGLKDRFSVAPGDNGIIQLTITHPDGERAAHVANIIVEQTLQDIFERERSATRDGLNYFADELLQVRADLDAANGAVRDYAITNNLQSAEELARTSAQLAQVRRDIDGIDESIRALDAMRSGEFDGAAFVQTHPVSTSLSFRRLLNLNGDPSDWERPSDAELDQAQIRLTAQKSPLLSTFNALEERAKNSGAEALELAALRREVEVQQAIYQSVITQFEARSLLSGFEQASGRIVETAIAPDEPTSPKKPLILALGMVLGLFAGTGLALITSMRRGSLYTRSAIQGAFALPEVRSLSQSLLGKIDRSGLAPKTLVSAQDFLVSFGEHDKVVPVAPTKSAQLSARFALGISKAAALMGEQSCILDLSQGAFEQLTNAGAGSVEEAFSKLSVQSGVDLLQPVDANSLLKVSTCSEQLDRLKARYDRVFVVLPTPDKGTAISHVVARSMDTLIVVAQRAKTTRAAVDAIKSLYAKSDVSDPLLVII